MIKAIIILIIWNVVLTVKVFTNQLKVTQEKGETILKYKSKVIYKTK
tara:strand:- start:1021 stop:1161 length:141 start_codon:yes stop_codon:yes gene_type:complete